MFGPFEVTGGFLKGKFRAINFRHPLGAFDLKILIIESAEQFALADFVADIDWQLGNASVDFRANRNLVGGTDVARRVDNKANIARLNDSGGRPRGCVGGWLNDRTMTPKKIASGAETGEHD